MKYRVLLSRQAEKFYDRLQRNVRVRIREALIGLENQPYAGKRLTVSPYQMIHFIFGAYLDPNRGARSSLRTHTYKICFHLTINQLGKSFFLLITPNNT